MEHWVADREAPIIYETSLDSTNLRLKTLAERGAEEGTVVITGRQTAGRGRLGRIFESPKGGLYLSMLLRPSCALEQVSNISALAAVAVCRAIREETGLQPGIKWPNDIVLNGRKLCGILVESSSEGAGCRLVVGIGINVNTAREAFPEELRAIACSVLTETGRETDNRKLSRQLVKELDALYAVWKEDSLFFLDEYRALCVNCGREVLVIRDENRSALALAVNDDCSLRVRYPDGREEDIRFGEVSVRGMLGYV